jgi:hypothetical protein
LSKTIRQTGYLGIIPAVGGFEKWMILIQVGIDVAMGGRAAWPMKIRGEYDPPQRVETDSIADRLCLRFSEYKAAVRRFPLRNSNEPVTDTRDSFWNPIQSGS